MEPAGTTWLLATVPAALAGAVLLAVAIRGLVRALRVEPLARLAVAAEQPFTLSAPGPVTLSVEGPLFTTKFSTLDFAVVESASGRTLPMRMILFRRNDTTLGGTTRLALRRFTSERTGAHVLRIGGLDPSADYGGCAIVLARPSGGLLPAWIVGVVAGALLLLGGSVASILLIAG